MSVTVIQNKFDGGIAEDIRTTATDQCEESLNFDVFTNPHYLQPYPDSTTEKVDIGGNLYDISPQNMSEVFVTSFRSGLPFWTYGYETDGVTASSSHPQVYYKANYNDNWTSGGYVGTHDLVRGSGVIFRETPYMLEYNSATYTYGLLKVTYPSTTPVVAGTITMSATDNSYCKPFVHPEDNVLYLGFGNNIVSWDDSTFSTYSSIIPSHLNITSLTNYGTYLVIACAPKSGYGKSRVYLWGRDGTINTLQGTIDVGGDSVKIVENINDNLVIVLSSFNYGSTTSTRKLFIKMYAGGAVEPIKTITVNTNSNIQYLYKGKTQDKLYFTGDGEDCLYAFGKNKEGAYVLTKDRYLYNGAFVNSALNSVGFSIIGDILYAGFKTIANTLKFFRTGAAYTSTSIYKTTINPSMSVGDRYRLKQLEAVQISYTGASSGTTVVKYSVDGSSFTTLISDTNTTGEHTTVATQEITTGNALLSGREFQFKIESTGGAKIKEIRYRYSVLNENI